MLVYTNTNHLALGLFWLFAAFSDKYRNTAVLTIVLFAGGLVSGRIISLFADGQPSGISLKAANSQNSPRAR
jgi:hypothetical protein